MTQPCIFCQIIKRQSSAKIVYEDERIVAFEDIKPVAPVHLLIIPKKHYRSLNEISPEDEPLLGHLISLATRLAEEKGLKKTGYRLVINTGPNSGQQIDHLHLHLLGGRPFSWPPG
ncbi:MAG: histidine triad nucleotide-binding protein [Candidatus Aminicenantes bacterium]|nr:histidine triad nucleotide-binding protein [Candidatus Aminicenantes bacterium]